MDEFIIRALLGGIGTAIVCGPLGCLIIWQKMSYFGAALSHAALLGVAIGLLYEINIQLCIMTVCIVFSCAMLTLERNREITTDTVLGILAHAFLAVGILIFSFYPKLRLDLFSYLFGDILAIGWTDIAWIYCGGLGVCVILKLIWNPLLSLVIQREIARVEGIRELRIRLMFLFILSVVISVSMQIVGVLLVLSLLIIPAAAARRFSQSPEKMAVLATIIGIFSITTGITMSMIWDTPAGPTVVVSATGLYLLSLTHSVR